MSWTCLQCTAGQFQTLPWPSLPAFTEPQGQPEVSLQPSQVLLEHVHSSAHGCGLLGFQGHVGGHLILQLLLLSFSVSLLFALLSTTSGKLQG